MAETTILLAEDETVVRRLVKEILNRAGYQVLEAANGVLALEVARQHSGPIHMLISNVAMPVMTGVELAQEMSRAHPGIRILLVSGYSDPRSVESMQGQPGFAYLRKPFAPKMLLQHVEHLLQGAAGI